MQPVGISKTSEHSPQTLGAGLKEEKVVLEELGWFYLKH